MLPAHRRRACSGPHVDERDHPRLVAGPAAAAVPAPRNRQRSNFELYSWLFMRFSGVVLVFLVLGHLFIMNILDGGVHRIDFAFVAGRWASPFWQIWDLLHAVAGRAARRQRPAHDHQRLRRRDSTRFWLKMLLCTASVLHRAAGHPVIFTFDPNIG